MIGWTKVERRVWSEEQTKLNGGILKCFVCDATDHTCKPHAESGLIVCKDCKAKILSDGKHYFVKEWLPTLFNTKFALFLQRKKEAQNARVPEITYTSSRYVQPAVTRVAPPRAEEPVALAKESDCYEDCLWTETPVPTWPCSLYPGDEAVQLPTPIDSSRSPIRLGEWSADADVQELVSQMRGLIAAEKVQDGWQSDSEVEIVVMVQEVARPMGAAEAYFRKQAMLMDDDFFM